MRKLRFFLLLVLCCNITGNAQDVNPFLNDANGRPLFWGSTFVAEGSPYYREEYNWAEITAWNGRVYKDIRVKFNMLDGEIVYLADNGVEMVATTPIMILKFPVITTENGQLLNVKFISGTNLAISKGTPLYLVLDSGKLTYLRKISVSFRDEKKYSEATTTRHFEKQETDFVLTPAGEYRKLEKSKAFLLSLMTDKQAAIETYISSNELKCKSAKDCQQVIHYYNTL
jgi:hypothetical protein